MLTLKTPAAIIGFPLLVFCVHGAALVSGLYNIRHFDSVMHFAGGFVAALSIYGMLSIARDRSYIRIDDRRVFRVLVIGLVAMVALGWEILEYLLDTYIGTEWQLTIADTLKDQVLGVLGGCVAVLCLRR